MKRLSAVAAGLAVIAFTLAGCADRPPLETNLAGWIPLFDGTEASLTKNWDRVGDANWRIFRGSVMADHRTGKTPGYLVSKNSYSDFQLKVEFWVTSETNSGVFMRCANPKQITDKTCYEANIWDTRPDPLYGTGGIVHRAAVFPMPKAGGKWNTYEITAKGNRISVWLNGNLTAELVNDELKSGPIALQYGQGVVMFRKVLIRPL
jgi:hypothetical protein